jgi:hypothetical protein
MQARNKNLRAGITANIRLQRARKSLKVRWTLGRRDY